MAARSLKADEIVDLLATLDREDEEEMMVDDPMELEVEEEAYIDDVGGGRGGSGTEWCCCDSTYG